MKSADSIYRNMILKGYTTARNVIESITLSNRHSHDMIERLEKAGLGFYVRATETQQRLGKYDRAAW